MLVCVLATVSCMCVRETMGSSSAKGKGEEKELLEHMDSSSFSLSDES